MPSNTSNKGFYIPDDGEDGWGDEKETDWRSLDTMLRHVGDDGSLSSALLPSGGDTLYDQTLNSTDDVSFNSASVSSLSGGVANGGSVSSLFGDGLENENGQVVTGAPVLDSGTVTHTTGGPTTVTLSGVSADQEAETYVSVGVDGASAPSADYAFNHRWGQSWDSANSQMDVTVELTWDTDPGQDMTLTYTVADLQPATLSGGYSDSQAVSAVDGNAISPSSVSTSSLDSEQLSHEKVNPTLSSKTIHTNAREVDVGNTVEYVDDEVSPGRIFSTANNGYKYSDDDGGTWDNLPTTPPGGEIVLAHNGYLFAVSEEPITVYRSDYPQDLSSLSWTQVHQSSNTNTAVLTTGNRYGNLAKDPDTGTLILGEYSKGSDGGANNPRLFRSTDDGASWTQVWEDSDSQIRHVHAVAADPYRDGEWIATLGDDGTKKALKSTDDGQTWTRKEYGLFVNGPKGHSSQPVGVDFTPRYYLFADDSGGMPHGPWFYNRETGETGQIFSTHPAEEYESYIRSPINLHIRYDEQTGIIYCGTRCQEQTKRHLFLYARFIGDKPQKLATTTDFSPRFNLEDGYAYVRWNRYPLFGGQQ